MAIIGIHVDQYVCKCPILWLIVVINFVTILQHFYIIVKFLSIASNSFYCKCCFSRLIQRASLFQNKPEIPSGFNCKPIASNLKGSKET